MTRAVPAVGVYVVGMHRSGTSAATRLLNLCGVPLCASGDLYSSVRGNERGLWESKSLVGFNDALLRRLGAEWWCPPRPNPGWARQALFQGPLDLGRALFNRLHPTPQWVWKDPRACITLPFWLRALGAMPVVVLMLRHPAEIAASLAARNKFGMDWSLALWERHMQHVVPALAGLPVAVARFDDVLADPVAWCGATAGFLEGHGVAIDRAPDAGAIRAFVDPALRHHHDRPDEAADQDSELSPPRLALYQWLLGAVGHHDRFEVADLPVESVATDLLFAKLRQQHRLWPRSTGPIRSLETLMARHPPRQAAPAPPTAASIVVISRNEGGRLRRTVDRLLATMPDFAEIVVVDDGSSDASADFLATRQPRTRLVRTGRQLGIAGARNLGAQEAKGECLIFCDAHVAPADGWVEPLVDALAAPGTGAAGPRLASMAKRAAKVGGLGFVDDVLNVRWLPPHDAEAYAVPLLPGCLLGVRREVFNELGGFDEGMLGYGAEDLELCMRLWRLGLECLVVPGSEVAHRFRTAGARRIDHELSLFNLLRLGILHLGAERLTRFLDALRGHDAFPRAMARIMAGDTFRRRAQLDGLMRFDDAWFFQRFDAPIFLEAANGNGARHDTTPVSPGLSTLEV